MQIKRGISAVSTINPTTASNMSKAVMGDEQITLVWDASAFVPFLIDDYIVFEGATWKLHKLPTVKKLSSKTWQYNAVFLSSKYDLTKVMYLLFDNTDTLPAGEFSYTGTALEFMQLLVANLNRVAGSAVWSVGAVLPNTDYKTLTFANEDCMSVLTRLAETFNTEYHVTNNIIHLERVSTDREATLEYGSTLYDIERSSVDSSDVVTRLYPFGSKQNLAANYRGGNSPLRLPIANGNYIESNVSQFGVIERSVTFDDIYPRLSSGGAGTITAVGDEFTFGDSNMDFNVNTYLLDGTTAKVHFNTGECAGYDFEIASYNNTTKTYRIIANTLENDFTLPTTALKPAVGDKYVLLDIAMPATPYVDNAEAELLARAQEYMAQNSSPKVSYKTTFSAIYARQNLQNVECGDTVTVYDANMGINEQIRIIKLQRGIVDYWNVQFDLANTVTATRLERIEGNVSTIENKVIVANERINRNNFRAYQNTKELQSMVFDAEGYFDPTAIKPLSIETSMLSVGAKSQSLQLSSILEPNYANNPQVLAWSAGLLTHFTIVDDAITEWAIAAGSITITGDNQTKALYIYARCNRAGTTGDIYLAPVALKFNEGTTYYYFLLGVLHTPLASGGSQSLTVRGISLTYGQTTINGQFVRTGVISSIDGATYFNLNTGEIGGKIKFASSNGTLKDVQTGLTEAQAAAQEAAAIDATTKVNNMVIGGVNTFSWRNRATNMYWWNGLTVDINNAECPYGFHAIGTQSGTGRLRISNVIKQNGWHTVSFEMRGSQNVMIGINVDICDNGAKRLYATTDNAWKRVELSVNVTNYSAATFNFVDFEGFDFAYHFVRNIKIEQGSKATAFSKHPDDVAAEAADVAAADATTKVENVKIGGSNLFRNGNFELNGVSSFTKININFCAITDNLFGEAYPKRGTKLLAISYLAGDSYVHIDPATKVEANTEYVLSYEHFDGGVPGSSSCYLVLIGSSVRYVHMPVTWAHGWHKEIFKFTTQAGETDVVFRFGRVGNDAAWSAVDLVQIEKGNKPTDWSPAPEDVAADIAAAKATGEAAATTANAITNNLTTIDGGLILTTLIKMLNGTAESAGMAAKTTGNDIAFWGGGTLEQAIQRLTAFGVTHSGDAWFKGVIEALSGKIGLFDILAGNIVGRDVDGIEKVRFGVENVPDISQFGSNYAVCANGADLSVSRTYDSIYWNDEYGYYWSTKEVEPAPPNPKATIEFFIPYATTVRIKEKPTTVVSSNPDAYAPPANEFRVTKKSDGSFVCYASNMVNFTINSAGIYILEATLNMSVQIPDGADRTYIDFTGGVDFIEYTESVQKTAIGKNGFYSYFSLLEHIFFKAGVGFIGRGRFDMPAGLGGASIGSTGVISRPWGKITDIGKVIKSGSNYTITHNIGDTDYSVILTPKSTSVPYFLDSNRQPNTVIVTCAGGFDFVLIRTK